MLAFISSSIEQINCLTIKKFKMGSVWIYLFLMAVLIASFVGGDKIHALGIFKGWFLFPVIFYVLLINNFNRKNVSRIFYILYASLITVSFWAILQQTGIIGQLFYQAGDISFNQYLSEGRAFGPFESPNYLAMYLVPMFFLSLPVLEIVRAKGAKLILVISFVFPLLALVLSQSRAGMITFVLSALIYFNYRFINSQKASNRKPFFSWLFVAFLAAVNAGYIYGATVLFKATTGGDQLRVEIYQRSLLLLKDNYFFGIGLGNFQTKIADVVFKGMTLDPNAMTYALHPHNLFFAIWLNLGLVGLVLFITLIVIFFKNVFSSDSILRATLIASMMAILIHGLFDTTYFKNDLSAIFWLIFAISLLIKEGAGKSEEN